MTKDEMQAEISRLMYELDAVPAIKAERDALTSDNASLHRQLERWQAIAIEKAKERDDANERAFMSTESHAMTMQRAMKAEAERDEYAKAADSMAMSHKVERDALAADYKNAVQLASILQKMGDEARAQYSDALGQISHLDAKRDALMSAAKLALDAIEENLVCNPRCKCTGRLALKAICKAGVK